MLTIYHPLPLFVYERLDQILSMIEIKPDQTAFFLYLTKFGWKESGLFWKSKESQKIITLETYKTVLLTIQL